MQEGQYYGSTTKRHMSLCVEGALSQIPNNNRPSFADDDNGRAMTNKQLRAHLMKARYEGKRVVPCGDCDNFDDQTGCRGHGIVRVFHDWKWEEGNG